ncbi:hypothetical protein P1P68_16280 [Streptomyces scabiei]|uniref:hypothetical protein n=1 Tax=Streptomyces scabiei TaxID=1930 RepID=UPI00298FCD7F|nr:hypothetical protein [Streptomyces scabiei]MDW8806299.1 hypothetical protein [Streptomyces scabiei]
MKKMGNLGKYQDITTQAAQAGGVDKWIEVIEEVAAAKAFPKAFSKGAGVGALSALAVAGLAVISKRALDERRAREALADEAKEQLKATKSNDINPKNGEGENDSDGGN